MLIDPRKLLEEYDWLIDNVPSDYYPEYEAKLKAWYEADANFRETLKAIQDRSPY